MHSTIKSKLVYQSKWLKLYEDIVKNRKGKIATFNRIAFRDVVTVVPIFSDGSVLMVKTYRHGAGQEILELPSGYIEKNEKPLKAAKRELLEETGHSCRSLRIKGWFYHIPSRSKQKVYVFVAKSLKLTSNQNLDDFENISVIKLSRYQVVRKMRTGQIKNASVIAALLLANF